MNQLSPPPPIQSLQNQGPWRVLSWQSGKSPKIHLASLCQIQEYPSPSPPTQSLQNQGPWRVPAWKGGKGPSFWKIQTGKACGHIHESACPTTSHSISATPGPLKGPGFNKIKKYTWHHFAKFKNIHPPHLPLNLYKIRAPGGSQLGRVVVSLILRFVVLTYMGFFAHDLAKPTHLLSNMECQPQRAPT